MEKLTPPNIATPEEIQAWQNMMETMVTFIKASTHLMNTINQKVGVTAAPPTLRREVSFQQQPYAQQQYPQQPQQTPYYAGCEPDCLACTPKPPCGVCTDESASAKKPGTGKAASDVVVPVVTVTPPTPERAEETPAEEVAAEVEPPLVSEEEEGANNPPDIQGEEAANEETEAPANEPPVAKEMDKLEVPGAKSSSKTKTLGSTGELVNDGTKCVCAAIRAKRMGVGSQSGDAERTKTEIVRGQENVEDLCGCTPTEEESALMVENIQNSLVEAREEISRMEGQVEELRKIVKPTRKEKESKALYNEIMKTGDSRNVRSQGDPSSRLPFNTFGTDISPVLPYPVRPAPMASAPPGSHRVPPMTFGASISPIYAPGRGRIPQQSTEYRSLVGPSAYPTKSPTTSPTCAPCALPPGYQSQDFRSLYGASAYTTRNALQPSGTQQSSTMATCGSACPGLQESDFDDENYYEQYQPPPTRVQRICTNRPVRDTTSGTAARTITNPYESYESTQPPQRYASSPLTGSNYNGSNNSNCNPTAACNQLSSRYR